MKGKHIRKEKKSIVWILITLFVLIGVIFGYFHFKSDDQENLSQYKIIVGTIKNVGDETLLIETNDHQKYLRRYCFFFIFNIYIFFFIY